MLVKLGSGPHAPPALRHALLAHGASPPPCPSAPPPATLTFLRKVSVVEGIEGFNPPSPSPCASQVPKALERAGISKDDVEVFELNEAFASQVGVCLFVLQGQGQGRAGLGGSGL